MTFVFHTLPEISAKDKKKQTRKGSENHDKHPRKYDHFQMLQDRINGMSWSDVAEKYGVKGGRAMAWRVCMLSQSIKKLAPCEIEKLSKSKN